MFSHDALWGAIERLARRRGWTLCRLATRAGLAPTAFDRSRRFTADGRPRWPSLATIAKLLDATDVRFTEFCRMVEHPGQDDSRAVAGCEIGLGAEGDTGILRKPIEPKDLVTGVEQLIARRPNRP